MLGAAITSEISVHIYKTARCHILKTKNFTFFMRWIASLTRASFKTLLLWNAVLKIRKRNAIRFVFSFTFIFPLLKIGTKYTQTQTHTQKQFIYCIGPFPSICITRDMFSKLNCRRKRILCHKVHGYTMHHDAHSIHTAPTLAQLISGNVSEGE